MKNQLPRIMDEEGTGQNKKLAVKVTANTAWLVGYRFFKLGISFFVVVLVARHLGVEGYGTLIFALTFAELTMNLVGPGLREVVIRRLSRTEKQVNREQAVGTAFGLTLAGQLTGFIITLLILLTFYPSTELRLVFLCVGAYYFFHSFDAIEFWFQYKLKNNLSVIIQAVAILISSGLQVLFVYLDYGITSIAFAYAVQSLLMGTGYFIVYRQFGNRFMPVFNRLYLKRLFIAAFPMILVKVLILFTHKADILLLGFLSGELEVGLYGVAVKFTQITHVLPLALALSILPVFSGMGREQLQRWSKIYYRFSFWGGLAIVVILYFMLPWVVPFVFGDAYQFSGKLAQVHIITFWFLMLLEVIKIRLLTNNAEHNLYLIYLVQVIFSIALNILLIPVYGAMASAWIAAGVFAAGSMILPFLIPSIRPEAVFMWRSVWRW